MEFSTEEGLVEVTYANRISLTVLVTGWQMLADGDIESSLCIQITLSTQSQRILKLNWTSNFKLHSIKHQLQIVSRLLHTMNKFVSTNWVSALDLFRSHRCRSSLAFCFHRLRLPSWRQPSGTHWLSSRRSWSCPAGKSCPSTRRGSQHCTSWDGRGPAEVYRR